MPPQAKKAVPAITAAMAQLRQITASTGAVTVIPDLPEVPAELKALLKPTLDATYNAVKAGSADLSAEALNGESTYKTKLVPPPEGYITPTNPKYPTRTPEYQLKKWNEMQSPYEWGSGSGPYRRLSNAAVQGFIAKLFTAVAKGAKNKTELARGDLFHCHLVYDDTDAQHPDLLLVFHSKETTSAENANKVMICEKLEPKVKIYAPTDAIHAYRNMIWSLRDAIAWNPSATAAPGSAMLMAGSGKTVQHESLGRCIADINYFPVESVKVFMKLH